MPTEIRVATLEMTVSSENGPSRRFAIQTGRTIVGRRSPSDIVLSEDVHLSGQHFAIDWDGAHCSLTDLNSSNGLFVGDQRTFHFEIHSSSRVTAGKLIFLWTFYRASSKPAPGADAITTPHDLLRVLPLYAILDAARNPLVPSLLKQSALESQSLYYGDAETQLAQTAPYLVRFDSEEPLLLQLIEQGWDNAWGVFFTSSQRLPAIRQHFRRFLMVSLESGRAVYFRFYDPRVLRVFIPQCTPGERREFFGPVDSFYVESSKPAAVLHFGSGTDAAPDKWPAAPYLPDTERTMVLHQVHTSQGGF